MKNKKLIINADDFGLTPGVTQGIIEAHSNGVVTSTTALSVSDYFLSAMNAARIQAPTLSIGIHLTLTVNKCKPILPKEKVTSLVDEDGFFWNQNVFLEKVKLGEVYIEWEAQIIRFLSSGQRPDHMDSHHNVHGKSEGLLNIALKLAQKFNLPLRNASRSEGTNNLLNLYEEVPTTDKMITEFYGEGVSENQLIQILDDIVKSEKELFEMNCHPAFIDSILLEHSSYHSKRIEELQILTSKEIKEEIVKRDILLTNYQLIN